MATTIELYTMLKDKLGEAESRALVETIEEFSHKAKEELGKELTTKSDLLPLAETKAELLKWMFIFWASQIGIIVALIKFLK
ncbi:MAG: hypothetical protein HQK92_01140 [Nitrospirae bacterium]|nr:hypothetical protein [Nitrospirota bacterium]